jgi:hypothetical protein
MARNEGVFVIHSAACLRLPLETCDCLGRMDFLPYTTSRE